MLLAFALLVALGCGESARFGSWRVVRAPHPPWNGAAAVSSSTPDDAFRHTRPGLTPSPPFDLPPIRSVTLGNGMHVVIIERHGPPIVAIRVVVGRGSIGAPPGVASLTAASLLEGTKWSPSLAIHERFAEMGAAVSTAASYEALTIDVKVPAPNLRPALEILDDILHAPTFPIEEVERVRARVLADLAYRSSRPEDIAALQLAAVLYPPDHPYHDPAEGSEDAIRRVGRIDLERFWHSSAVPPLTSFILVGDMEDLATLGMLRQLFEGWSGAAPPALPRPPPVATTTPERLVLVDHPNDPQCVMRVGWLVADRNSEDIPALRTLAATLAYGTSGKLDSLLRRQRGETYDVRATLTPRIGVSEFVVAASVERDKTVDALRETLAEIERMRTQSLVPSDLPDARAVLRSSLQLHSFESSEDVVIMLTDPVVHRDAVDVFRRRLLAPVGVRPEQEQLVASRYLTSPSRRVVVVGDASRVRPSLEALGLGEIAVR
jgi:predicted Zn-dependent peptidase